MDYNAPFGSADPNAAYVDRNTPGAVAGSKVPALAIEMPQREIVTVIKNAGLTPNKTDPTQLDQAIDQKILAITGGGGDENYVLMTQARVRLPIFPEVMTADGLIPVISPSAGQVRVPAGYEFLHRGIFSVTTVQADFATAANKTYHLRWMPSGGFSLRDLADAAYNPTAAAESSRSFDSTYDDMLVARVVTNAGNSPTVTNLVNKNRILLEISEAGSMTSNTGVDDAVRTAALVFNLARTPVMAVTPVDIAVGGSSGDRMSGSQSHDHDLKIIRSAFSRYGATLTLQRDYATSFEILATITA
jgi:hypothetical protein